ncbi:hypothetical protein PILCRDRAFT_15881 [Piloderma croceum F 1598]|uniref:Uncharacterized protein n=1 Tax=Piloderma croceum (strain F 1598) TaxID=765440 RepID=A0A0C3B5Y6_PILCF|nr:hypothetical protein PILCRDRAFT_15881 [Piloderma croceum F 1598]
MDARWDGDFLILLLPMGGTSSLPEGVFPETLKDLKTLDILKILMQELHDIL